MTTTIADKTLKELVLENPDATRIFEKLGMDYCCGGQQTLEEACRKAGYSVEQVATLVEAGSGKTAEKDWRCQPLADLIDHIKSTHHQFTRQEIARLGPLFNKVCSAHGLRSPELIHMRKVFAALAEELTAHLTKEEVVLFPYVVRLEQAVYADQPVSRPPFGTVRNPISMMLHEHDGAGDALRELRRASKGYDAPAHACLSFQTLYRALIQLETDLHQHIHLENNILFPRAIELETRAR